MSKRPLPHSSVILILFVMAALLACNLFQAISPNAQPVATAPPTIGPTPTPYVFPGQQAVQLAWFYKPPNDGDLATLFEYFDFFILTENDEAERDDLKARGITRPILQYLRFDAIMDPGGCDKSPWHNQVASQRGDYCKISLEHPEWFLLDGRGQRIVDSDNFVMMDPGNLEWRAFWLERARQSQESLGWFGVFLDNVEGGLGKYLRYNKTLLRYSDEASYRAAIEGFLAYIYSSYFHPQGRPLYANIIYLKDWAVFYNDLRYLDGAMLESWATDWERQIKPDEWEEHMQAAEKAQAYGKDLILVAQGDQSDTKRQEFTFASYLLITEGRASFRYARAGRYKETWLYLSYDFAIGIPLGLRYRDGDVWKRDFTDGVVTVDPKAHTATINLR